MDAAVLSDIPVAEHRITQSHHCEALGYSVGAAEVTSSVVCVKALSSVLSTVLVLVAMLFSFPAHADRGAPWDGYAAPADYYAVVGAVEGLNVRMEPSADWDRLTTLGYGTRVHVIGSAVNFNGETWLKLDSGGWVIATGVVEESQYQPPAPPEPEPAPAPEADTSQSEKDSAERAEADSGKNLDDSDSDKDAAAKDDKDAAEKNDKDDVSEKSESDKSKEELAAEEAGSDTGFWVIIAVLIGVAAACVIAIIALAIIFVRGGRMHP